MFPMQVNRLLVATLMALAIYLVPSCASLEVNRTKLTLSQKVASSTNTDKDFQLNTIPGSSDYVPENLDSQSNQPHIGNFVNVAKHNPSTINTTRSQANVFEATATANGTQKDPLMVNAQSPNPFMTNGPGGMNPQIALLLQNNPRLQMLARQNPIVAQQIMRNPQLLRDPQIQRAIQSQMQPGQGQNLLGQLGQIGLLRALNPLGIGLNPMMNRQVNPMQQNPLSQNQLNQNGMNQNAMNQNALNRNQNGQRNNFGLPRTQSVPNANQETLPGGYYGNNDNYQNPSAENANEGGEEGGGGDNSGEGAADNGNQDYDGNTGADENQGGEEGNSGEDSQQNPAEDPDIQQLQNFGGPVNDNFPEGLFPPGLLSKEDLDEIRKQQEKEAREQAEKERQQQQQQNPQGGQGADYEDNSGDDGSGGGGEEVPAEGAAQEGTDDGSANNVETGTEDGNNVQGQGQPQQPEIHQPQTHSGHSQGGYQPSANPVTPNLGYTTPTPPAYHNTYQPIQPVQAQRVPLQPSVNYANDYPSPAVGNVANHKNNQFNYQPGVQYDQPNGYQQLNNYQQTTTASPISISQQYGRPPHSPMSPMTNTFNSDPQHQPQYNGFNMNRPHNQQLRQSMRPWQSPQPQYTPHSSGGYSGGNNVHSNRMNPMAFGNNHNNELSSDEPSPSRPFSTQPPGYRSNMFNEPRQFQQRPRPFLS